MNEIQYQHMYPNLVVLFVHFPKPIKKQFKKNTKNNKKSKKTKKSVEIKQNIHAIDLELQITVI